MKKDSYRYITLLFGNLFCFEDIFVVIKTDPFPRNNTRACENINARNPFYNVASNGTFTNRRHVKYLTYCCVNPP